MRYRIGLMRVGVLGIGRVGLPTAATLASMGHSVVAADIDRDRVATVAGGVVPFPEPGLEALTNGELSAGRLSLSHDPADAVQGVNVVFICVDTPSQPDGRADLSRVMAAAEGIVSNASGTVVVAQKSSVPVGTGDLLAEILTWRNGSTRLLLVSNPEFLQEGSAVQDCLQPSRILVGSDSDEALSVMRKLYSPLLEAGTPWIETDLRTAELAKYACNAFLTLKISYANALAALCETAAADVTAIADVMGADSRIGRAYLDAGLGFGGACLPKDLAAFAKVAGSLGHQLPLLEEVARINDQAVEGIFRKVESAVLDVEGKKVALLGLAFKPGTDDIRAAPALALARRLLGEGALVWGYDPLAGPAAKNEVDGLEIADDPYSALEGASCGVLCTDWEEFRHLDLDRAREVMAFPVIVDGRNLFDPTKMQRAGFTYVPTGRLPRMPSGSSPPTPIGLISGSRGANEEPEPGMP
jgi:UDPglucose 6-dehydrogenase